MLLCTPHRGHTEEIITICDALCYSVHHTEVITICDAFTSCLTKLMTFVPYTKCMETHVSIALRPIKALHF